MEAWVHGVSTRKVDDLVKALGAASGVSKSEVSRICAELDRDLEAFRTRKLEGEFPYVFADATYVKARVNGRVVSRAVVVATGVTATGEREVLGVEVGDSEDGAFWTGFLRSLRARGLSGVQLVISDHHLGLKSAIAAVFVGSSWQCLPGALDEKRPGPSPEGLRRDGRRVDPHHLRSARRYPCPLAVDRDRRDAANPVPGRGRHARRHQRGPPRLHCLPRRSLEEDLVHEPALR